MTNLTLTIPGKYTNGSDCYITKNAAYPGILGYGKEPEEAQASFEEARVAFEKLTNAKPQGAAVSMTVFKPVTSTISTKRIPPQPAYA